MKTEQAIKEELELCYEEIKRMEKEGIRTDKIKAYITGLQWVLEGK